MFNVQHPEAHIWEADLTATTLSYGITFEATAFDPGADDLTFYWDFGDGTIIIKVYPNINNPFPVRITDTLTHTFSRGRRYSVTLTVEDYGSGFFVAVVTLVPP
ncbi:MAG: PKD domain-containing protein [Thermoplasmata archaeon]